MIAKLWSCSFKPEHLKSGFRATGLFPTNRAAIPTNKLLPSVPFESVTTSRTQSEVTSTSSSSKSEPSIGTNTTIVCQQLKCKVCGNDMTPVQLHIVAYFSRYLQNQNANTVRDKKRVKPQIYGEALTKDEIMLRIEEHEEQKKTKGKKRKHAEIAVPGIVASYLLNLQCMCMYNIAIAIHMADIAK